MTDDADDREHIEIPDADPGRRRFLKIATCAIGGGLGAVVVVPAARYLLHPVGEDTVVTGAEPIDVIGLDELAVGAPPVRVALVARAIRDAWSAVTDVPLGAVWLSRPAADTVVALSSICPHLGCAVGLRADGGAFECPCHESSFTVEGRREAGPAERDLDPLPVEVKDGRVLVTWIRYRAGGADRTPA